MPEMKSLPVPGLVSLNLMTTGVVLAQPTPPFLLPMG